MAQTSKKLYKAVAAEIAATYRNPDYGEGTYWVHVAIDTIVKGLADIFAADHLLFDREKFYAACHKEEVSVK